MDVKNITFKKCAVMVAAVNEVQSLKETIEDLQAVCSPDDVAEFIIYLAPFATSECKNMAESIEKSIPGAIPVVIVSQKPNLPIMFSLKEYLKARNEITHLAILPADRDLEVAYIPAMLAVSKVCPNALVRPSRFMVGGQTNDNKSAVTAFLLSAAQWLIRILFNTRFTDPTYGVSVIPCGIFTRFHFCETSVSCILEFTLPFFKLKLPAIELPAVQKAREENESTNSFGKKMRYLVPLFKIFFTPKSKLLEEQDD
ncbi:MAG: hypothetical protein LBQ80_05400 [Clostridium sp.]|jgi:hypothetical protein|nr:hypothetical protein [Clostridium sp.]